MNNSLREQLLKTGLISKEQVNQTEKQVKAKVHQAAKEQQRNKKHQLTTPIDTDSVAYQVAQAQAVEVARAKELNRQRDLERQTKERLAQARQLIECFHVNEADANLTYYFVEGKLVRHLLVNSKQRKQLACGQLGIATLDEHYYLVPTTVLEKLLERAPETVVCFNQAQEEEITADDPYASYRVPEDLVW